METIEQSEELDLELEKLELDEQYFSEKLAYISEKYFEKRVKQIKEIMNKDAEKGKLFTEIKFKDLENKYELCTDSDTINSLELFFQNDGFSFSNTDNCIKISWKHVLDKNKTLNLKYKEIDDLDKIDNMVNFIKRELDNCVQTIGRNNKERIAFNIYNTMLNMEKKYPEKNDRIFKTQTFINTVIDKLIFFRDNDNITWAQDFICKFNKIKETRGLDQLDH